MPIYTYRCSQGHTWDEVRGREGSEASEEPCATCMDSLADALHGNPTSIEVVKTLRGNKVPASFGVAFRGKGWTPKHYPNRAGK